VVSYLLPKVLLYKRSRTRQTVNLTVKCGTHRVATPVIAGLYSYHIFPMIVILILVGFWPLL